MNLTTLRKKSVEALRGAVAAVDLLCEQLEEAFYEVDNVETCVVGPWEEGEAGFWVESLIETTDGLTEGEYQDMLGHLKAILSRCGFELPPEAVELTGAGEVSIAVCILETDVKY